MMKRINTWLRQLPGWNESKATKGAWIAILVISFLAVFGPFIANEKPYFCQLEGEIYFPVFSNASEATLSIAHPKHSPVQWRKTEFENILRTPIPYSHTTLDFEKNANVGPFDHQEGSWRFRHWLGTDTLGRDVMAGMIRGCRVSVLIGLGSMLIALCLGVFLGTISGYIGNRGARMTVVDMLLLIGVVVLGTIIAYSPFAMSWKVTISFVLFFGFILYMIFRRQTQKTVRAFPLDGLILGIISVIDGIPGMFLILIMIGLLPFKGWVVVMCVIAFLKWPVMARYMRAEVMRMKELNYIKAAELINMPRWKIMWQQIAPYAFRPVMVSFIFGVANAILTESTLSFLGIGLPVEEMNWGRLLAQSRSHFEAWWLVVFPGGAIFFTLLALYVIGNAWQRHLYKEVDPEGSMVV